MTTVAQAFATFLNLSLTPTVNQQADIAAKVKATEGYLRKAFPSTSNLPLNRVALIGSAARGTLIRPVNDVDVLAQFTNKDDIFETYRNDSVAFIGRVRTALSAHTSVKQVGARGQAVRLFYVNGAHVDIAPLFKWSGGGYALPSGDGRWITTDPDTQADWFTNRTTTVGSSLPIIIKLLKRWNKVHSNRLASYHLEVMVATVFKTVGINHRDAVKCFFEWAPTWIDVKDPAGHSGVLSTYLTQPIRQALLSRLAEALGRTRRALDAEAAGKHDEAKQLWRVELGDEFPSS